ncbi:YhgE/Pip domain-containing protein [Bifidobacterium sp. 82T24]|uniref:YhgE/Pip domain-containing protein n=1 Tax=Bifidobacterium saimiriisciurei TaxID=2661627 RepID=A0ABX0C8K2_9BIFI|nr:MULTISPECIES: YhgE/Pip domain-containing protein [Bifidobacterium]MBW3088490.1 YhgE/Pip domain-containing protein [Bifidobacterium pluvialisilvae]NEG96564.1 YhgE/Pip domain-containing protein [Bifidobacterium sp. SMB2]NEH10519.1 YhgE/Pip domain-containing protein [Bifidobacterium saimiriisciurei]NEH10698.1 YhgE/Pip domain-containing protein [Bifidobacterium saimiriisciurei]
MTARKTPVMTAITTTIARKFRNVGRIVAGDVRRITSNVTAVTLVIGLVAMPSLFAWFNVAANWDPFGSTGELKVAVANNDAGYRSDLVPVKVNVGENVVSALRANDQLDWVFTDERDAVDGTESGEYYAAVVIPKTFSRDMMTLFSADTRQAKIAYYTNEKKNPLAPKVTGQGADAVTAQVNDTFNTTISSAGLTIASQLAESLDSDSAQTLIGNLNANIDRTSKQFDLAADNLDQYGDVLDSAQTLVATSAGLVGKAGGSAADARKATDQAKQGVATVAATLDSSADTVGDALDASANSYQAAEASLDKVFDAVGTQGADSAKQLRAVATKIGDQVTAYQDLRGKLAALTPTTDEGTRLQQSLLGDMDEAIAKQTAVRDSLNSAADGIDKGLTDGDRKREEAKTKAEEARKTMAQVSDDFDKGLKTKLAAMSSAASDAYTETVEATSRLETMSSELSGSADSIAASMAGAHTDIAATAKSLRASANRLSDLHGKIAKALNSGDLKTVRKILGDDPEALATSLVSPVGLNRNAVYKADNFGSSMAPMYTTLGLWMGALLLSLAILVQVSGERKAALERPTPGEMFLGRFGIYAILALLQSTVMCLGELVYLRVQCDDPWLFMLGGWATSLTFAFIVYTMAAAFGAPGKALCVLVMVMQITGAGGSFPVAVLPDFFQAVHPFLPATHAIDMFRAAVFGVYRNDYWIAMGRLAVFILPMLLLGLVLRRPLMRLTAKSEANLRRTKVLG